MSEPRFTVLLNHTGKCRVNRAARWKKRPTSLSRYSASGSDVCRSTESWFRGTKLVIAQAHAWTALSSCAKDVTFWSFDIECEWGVFHLDGSDRVDLVCATKGCSGAF